ncbi:MAG: DUF6515 family protein [Candidatus Omnitrophota bacterium]
MNKKIFSYKFWLAVVFSLIIAAQFTPDAFARPGIGRPHGGRENIVFRHEGYRYHNGRFYRPAWFGLFEIAVNIPPIGTIITVLPSSHKTIIARGVTYYYYDNIYFTACPYGYIVVPAPLENENVVIAFSAAVPPQKVSGETLTINVPNTNGSYTAVALVKQKDGYIGPQGEYYPEHPTIDQLKVLYGK